MSASTTAGAKLDAVTRELENAYDYLTATLLPCDPDCECVLHGIEAVLGKPDTRRADLTPGTRLDA